MTPVLLDITRTVSRGGRGPATGIDRVERAYIRWALTRPGSAFVSRLGQRVALVAADAMPGLLTALDGIDGERHWPLAGLIPGKNPRDRRAELALRRVAHAAARWPNLGPAINSLIGSRFSYINVGHTHLSDASLTHLKALGATRIGVMIHDTIPLDYPDTQTHKSASRFKQRLTAATSHADILLTSSQATASSIARHLTGTTPVTIILLGVDPTPPGPPYVSPTPYFVQLGTIEPRKNTALLLDVWDRLIATGVTPPQLHLIGARGWMVDDIIRRVEALQPHVVMHHGLSDSETAARIRGALALLFPTLAEGFGYPLFEALQMGVPVIASDLPVFRELAPEGPLYLQSHDVKSWFQAVESWSPGNQDTPHHKRRIQAATPRWSEHFEHVERLI